MSKWDYCLEARFFLNELEIPKHKFRVILKKNPRVMLYSLADNLVPKIINYGIMTLQMDPATHITRLLLSYPQVLDYNLERHIQPITQYFLNELEFCSTEFRTILLRFPRVLTYSLRKIKHNVGYLRYELELDAAGVKRVLYQAPQVLGGNVEGNLACKVEFLQQQVLGSLTNGSEEEAREAVRKIILGLPTVLNLSVAQNLQPKLEYLRSMLLREERSSLPQQESPDNAQIEEPSLQTLLWQLVVKKPALLGYSLEKRIKPRLERVITSGLPFYTITSWISMTEEKFESWLYSQQGKKAKKALVLKQSGAQSSDPHNEKY